MLFVSSSLHSSSSTSSQLIACSNSSKARLRAGGAGICKGQRQFDQPVPSGSLRNFSSEPAKPTSAATHHHYQPASSFAFPQTLTALHSLKSSRVAISPSSILDGRIYYLSRSNDARATLFSVANCNQATPPRSDRNSSANTSCGQQTLYTLSIGFRRAGNPSP